MKVAFIHVGMIKTASTYMQNVWLRDPAYALSWRTNEPFITQLQESVRNDDTKEYLPWTVAIEPETPFVDGQEIIISNESFSTTFLNEIEQQWKILDYIEYTSHNLGRIRDLTQNVLIMVREPHSWIQSVHNQAIKQGWSGSAQDFVEQQATFLKHSLNLEFMVKAYRRSFENVVVLPYEMMKRDEDAFWNTISSRFNVPMVQTRLEQRANTSLDAKKLYLLSKMNENPGLMATILGTYASVDDAKTYIENWISGNRRFVQEANDERVRQLYEIYRLTEPEDGFLDFELPREVRESIQRKFLDFIKKHVSKEYAGMYQETL